MASNRRAPTMVDAADELGLRLLGQHDGLPDALADCGLEAEGLVVERTRGLDDALDTARLGVHLPLEGLPDVPQHFLATTREERQANFWVVSCSSPIRGAIFASRSAWETPLPNRKAETFAGATSMERRSVFFWIASTASASSRSRRAPRPSEW